MLFAAGLITLALCAGCGEVHARLTAGPPRPVTVAVDGPPSALFAPLYAAQADGEFRAGALGVTISSTSNPLAALVAGRAAVAIASEPQLLAARGAGDQLVAIGALLRDPLEGIVSLARRPVHSAAELRGHTVATDGTPLAAALLATALAASSVAPSKVRRIDAGAGLVGALRARRAIATVGGPWPLEAVELTQARLLPIVLAPGGVGVPAYDGEVVVVRVGEAHTGRDAAARVPAVADPRRARCRRTAGGDGGDARETQPGALADRGASAAGDARPAHRHGRRDQPVRLPDRRAMADLRRLDAHPRPAGEHLRRRLRDHERIPAGTGRADRDIVIACVAARPPHGA